MDDTYTSILEVIDQPYTPFLPKLLLISCHKELLFNSEVSYINIFKTFRIASGSGTFSDLAPVS